MARNFYRITVSSYLALCLASCHDGAASAPANSGSVSGNSQASSAGPRFDIVGPATEPLEECGATSASPKEPPSKTVVRVLLDDSMLNPHKLRPSKPKKFIKTNKVNSKPQDTDDAEEYDDNSDEIGRSQVAEYNENPYHIDFKTIPNSPYEGGSSWFEVRVILDIDNMEFWHADGDVHAKDAVQKPVGKFGEAVICRPANDFPNVTTGKKQLPVFTFFVKRALNVPATEIQLNVVFAAKAGYAGSKTPMIVDPKIKNDG